MISSPILTLPATGTLVCITDPSNANIYIDGVLQVPKTSTSITVSAGSHTILFTKPGYQSYTTTVTVLANQTINACAILQQIVRITNYGIVICTTSNISSCPITPVACPMSITPTDYVNFIAVLTSTSSVSLTVNFIYTLNGTSYTAIVPVTLSTGTNIVYAFSTNTRYSPNTTINMVDITLS